MSAAARSAAPAPRAARNTRARAVTILRTGKAPLEFTGRQVFHATAPSPAGVPRCSVRLWAREDAGPLLDVRADRAALGVEDLNAAWVARSPNAALARLEAFDPLAKWVPDTVETVDSLISVIEKRNAAQNLRREYAAVVDRCVTAWSAGMAVWRTLGL